MIQVMCTLQVLGFKVTDSVRRRMNGDAGQTAAEYMGIIVIVALIIAAIVGTGVAADIANNIKTKVASIFAGTA